MWQQVLIPALLHGGWRDLHHRCGMVPGVPLKPMLAKICEGLDDALAMLSGHAFLAEYKYDGMRAQIHVLEDGRVCVFSRNCEDRTASFPDVVAAMLHATQGRTGWGGWGGGGVGSAQCMCIWCMCVLRLWCMCVDTKGCEWNGVEVHLCLYTTTAHPPTHTHSYSPFVSPPQGGCTSCVIDAEVVAVDRSRGNTLRAFQELSTRARGEVTLSQVGFGVGMWGCVVWAVGAEACWCVYSTCTPLPNSQPCTPPYTSITPLSPPPPH